MDRTLLAAGFDLDFTLWDQEAFTASFFGAIAWELGGRLGCGGARVERVFQETVRHLCLGHPNVFDEALRRMGVEDPGLVAELVDRYHRHRPLLRPYPGVRGTLHKLRERGLRLFLVTDGKSDTQRYKVDALGLGPSFDELVYTGDFPPILHKPSAFPFLLACRKLGVRPERCAFVGDNPLCDFEAPRRLGMLTIGVPTGPYAALPVPPGQAPELRIGAFEQLEALL